MLVFILRRLVFIAIVLFVSSILIFGATQILPGDVAQLVLGQYATDEAIEALRAQMGLNRPLVQQYLSWFTGFIQGEWGWSLSTDMPVAKMLGPRIINSIYLALVSFFIYVPLGILLGIIAALKRNKLTDHIISIFSISFIGIPEFVTGVILISIFSFNLGWFPSSSSISSRMGFVEAFPYLVLPALSVSLICTAYIARMTRASTIEVLFTDYVRTAYLKGFSHTQVIVKHVLRNSLLPTITVIANQFGWLLSGLIVVETFFNYPGLGRMLLFGIQRQDIPLIQASTMILVSTYCIFNLIADILYSVLTPQIRYR